MGKTGNWLSTDLKDLLGRSFKVGDKVARAVTSGRASNLSICEVTKIDNGKLFLDGSKYCINYPGRLLIITEIMP